MIQRAGSRPFAVLSIAFLILGSAGEAAFAAVQREHALRFDDRVVSRAGGVIGTRAVDTASLDAADALRQGWEQFAVAQGGGWNIWVDERSGLPLLAVGRGIPWVPGPGNALPTASSTAGETTLQDLAALAESFLGSHEALLGNWTGQLVLDTEASGRAGENVRLVTFRQQVGGVPVEGARYDFQVSQGNLVSFGATRWAPVLTPAVPTLDRAAARAVLHAWLGIEDAGEVVTREEGRLHLIPVDAHGTDGVAWSGTRGAGYVHRLVWRFVLTVPGESGTWVGEVDAHSGAIVSVFDDTRYERVKGAIFPIANDGICATGGCEEAGYPMPFADYSVDQGPVQDATVGGVYDCSVSTSSLGSRLDGPFVSNNDNCGNIIETGPCGSDLDFGIGAGPDCQAPAGDSAGNTRSGRTTFYHLNVIAAKARQYLPSRTWLEQPLTNNLNINQNCNAFWNGSVNFYTSGGGCSNTGENKAVIDHEWGHGMDQNDGGGFDNSSEGYADITAFFETRESCVGRNFRPGTQCGGYGDTCLNCTGIRDQDWGARQDQTPATPSGFVTNNCGGGSGPCGRAVHCEGYVAAESLWDLAVRDLPAMGLDPDSAWQHAERLWYLSRLGSGGNAYNCSLPSSDGCGTNSWFHKLRVIDDDDGNLANGTPHAAAIFAAFDRHDIACGLATDATNQNTSSCPAIAAPVVTTTGLANAVEVSWGAVANADSYTVYRNDLGCNRGQLIAATVAAPGTTVLDENLGNNFTVNYRVQAVGSNPACRGAVSACSSVQPLGTAGRVVFKKPAYACDVAVTLEVRDENVAGSTVSVDVSSGTETTPETVVLTETEAGSSTFLGQIFTTTAAPAADGLLSVVHADSLTAQYVDADDGSGGVNQVRLDSAVTDCIPPVISAVAHSGVTDSAATVTWSTDKPSDSVVNFGETAPPGSSAVGTFGTMAHNVQVGGLNECTRYVYEAQSTDSPGNVAVDDNAGQYYGFETLIDHGQGLQDCSAGRVALTQPSFNCDDGVTFELVDIDLNLDPAIAETFMVPVSSSTETDPETVVVTETGPNTSRFSGTILTQTGPAASDGVLQVGDGDVVTVTYDDSDDGTGATALSFDTGALDCNGPAIQNLRIENVTDQRFTVLWDTSEPGDTFLEWGPTPALGNTFADAAPKSSHQVVLNQFDLCQDVYLRVSTTDAAGNTSVADLGGSPYSLRTWDIPGLYWRETFESGGAGWITNGEFEIGAPQGLGGAFGQPDPGAAYNNATVLGNDLSGTGSQPGDYEYQIVETATSPAQNASSWTNTKLLFYRHLNVRSLDSATVTVVAGGTTDVFTTSSNIEDSDYSLQSFDVSAQADGQPSVAIRYGIASSPLSQPFDDGIGSGWNVDDVILKDGSLPDYAACGGCTVAPAFNGAVEATDNDACGASGVTVSWNPAVSWGTGNTGTYSVYRDTVPGFTPSAANRIATGVTGQAYNDAGAPTDQTLYYLVESENDEACSTGPNNGGLTDGNSVTVGVSETTSRPVPDEITTAMTGFAAGVHVRIDWPAAAGAVSYNVYRSSDPQPGTFVLVDTTDEPFFEDVGEAVTANTFFYKVFGVNACGQEGP